MDMIDLRVRFQKLEELKMQGKKITVGTLPQWAKKKIDEDIILVMQIGEKEVLKNIAVLGMLSALCRENVLKLEGSEIICINPPGMETFASWEREMEPDENTVIAHEDLLELDNEVLLESIGEAGHGHRRALTGLAARASLAEVEEVDDYEDEDSPAQCSLFTKRLCKYQDGAFKPPRHTMWIGCSYPLCNRWYHEQCLSLLFKTEKSRRTYTLICPEHTNIREHFQNKIVALASDPHSLESENISLQPLPNV